MKLNSKDLLQLPAANIVTLKFIKRYVDSYNRFPTEEKLGLLVREYGVQLNAIKYYCYDWNNLSIRGTDTNMHEIVMSHIRALRDSCDSLPEEVKKKLKFVEEIIIASWR